MRKVSEVVPQLLPLRAAETDRRASRSNFDLVQRAEMLALADLDKPLHVAALSRTLGVSERMLRKAFNHTYGLSPCRHLRMLRLFRVRRALLSAHNQVVTVTQIATSFGFAELGRFSVEYRKVFGESPSVTLRRASCPIGEGAPPGFPHVPMPNRRSVARRSVPSSILPYGILAAPGHQQQDAPKSHSQLVAFVPRCPKAASSENQKGQGASP